MLVDEKEAVVWWVEHYGMCLIKYRNRSMCHKAHRGLTMMRRRGAGEAGRFLRAERETKIIKINLRLQGMWQNCCCSWLMVGGKEISTGEEEEQEE